MNSRITHLLLGSLLAAIVNSLSGCGGSGSSGSNATTSAPPVAVTPTTLTGVAAIGAPLVGAVLLKDSSKIPVQLTTITASDGSFVFNTTGLTPPFMVATAASSPALYALADANGLYNLTPLTTLALAYATGGADLDALYRNHLQSAVDSAASKMASSVLTVQKVLLPLLSQYGVTTNILTAPFSANHTGVDALLDAVAVSIAGGVVTITNKATDGVILSTPIGSLATATLSTSNMPAPGSSPVTVTGLSLYTANCAGCHGAIGGTSLRGAATVRNIQSAIASNLGGMGMLAKLPAADIQLIADSLTNSATPPPAATQPDGATLYAANCAACHGALASSSKLGISVVRLQNAISGNVGGMGRLAALTVAEMQAVTSALNASAVVPPVANPDGAALYSAQCASCHGALGSTAKKGSTLARLQNAIAANIGGMGALSTLSVLEVQAIITALTPSTPTPTPTPSPTPDGAALYAASCASCHGALATSTKGGATAARIQTAISSNAGGMASLSTLTATQVAAIASALVAATPAPGPATDCGGCHAMPPATGRHTKHTRENVTCATCHGAGYSTSSVVAATHNNGIKNVASGAGWNSTKRSCANSCHGKESW